MPPESSWAGAAAVAAIAFACAFYYTAIAWFTHRERMAKIAQGIDPDNPERQRPRPSEAIQEVKR